MRQEAPLDLRPGALVRGGLGRGALLVFLPLVLVGQAVAWIAYALTGAYRPWSWVKIGLAYALTSVRVPFDAAVRGFGTLDARPIEHGTLVVALGALTILVLVLAFRAGRAQARGFERRPLRGAIAGALIGPGLAIPLGMVSFVVDLRFPGIGIERLEPVHLASLVFPLVVGSAAGALGGASAARETLEAAGGWRAALAAAARAGGTACWLGLAFAFVGFLAVAALQLDATRAYGRFVGSGKGGMLALVHHAMVLPNQSAMILATSMGAPTILHLGETEVPVRLSGITQGADLFGVDVIAFPAWFAAFVLVPAASTVLGGRQAASGARGRRDALARAALGAFVYAGLCGALAWTATIALPLPFPEAPPVLGPSPLLTAAFGCLWGLAGMPAGAWWWQRRAAIAAARPR